MDMIVLSLILVSSLTTCFLLIYLTNFWMKHTQELVNKLMSRDYHEFKTADIKVTKKDIPKVQNYMPEDLRALQELEPLM